MVTHHSAEVTMLRRVRRPTPIVPLTVVAEPEALLRRPTEALRYLRDGRHHDPQLLARLAGHDGVAVRRALVDRPAAMYEARVRTALIEGAIERPDCADLVCEAVLASPPAEFGERVRALLARPQVPTWIVLDVLWHASAAQCRHVRATDLDVLLLDPRPGVRLAVHEIVEDRLRMADRAETEEAP